MTDPTPALPKGRESSEPKIIGIVQEAKKYPVGRYTFVLISVGVLPLPDAEAAIDALMDAHLERMQEMTVVHFWNELYKNGKAFDLLRPALRVEGHTLLDRLMFRTPIDILKRVGNMNLIGGMLQDFFVYNFSSTLRSGSTPAATAST